MRISDWSSDVCSSDLFGRAISQMELSHLLDIVMRYTPELIGMPPAPLEVFQSSLPDPILELTAKNERGQVIHEVRSEERSVGKECVRTCSSRWTQDP